MTAPCGTYAAYSRHHGCRCEACRQAKADYIRERRHAAAERARSLSGRPRRGRLPVGARLWVPRYVAPNATHGIAASYVELGCRCWDCTDAVNKKRRDEMARQRARKQANA